MFNTPPLVSIISVNYKQLQITIEFLISLQKITYPNIEVFIVDNASNENVKSTIHNLFPNVNVIESLNNLGFAGGNNLAIRKANGKYLLFINNDTEVDPGFLESLVSKLESDSLIGIASPKIIYYNQNELIQFAGAKSINKLTGRGSILKSEYDKGQYDVCCETGLIHGAAMIVPMEVIKKVGLMPEIYFLYYEELDWCEMIKKAGFKALYIGKSKIYHKESVSVGRDSPFKTYWMARNRLIFIKRNTNGLNLVISFLFFVFVSVPKNIMFFLIRGKFAHAKSFLKGLLWSITHNNIYDTPRL